MEIDFLRLAEEVKTDKQPRRITPRQLFNAFNFERRTPRNCYWVDKFLDENSLMVTPHYNEVWIDDFISLEHKPIAKTQMPADPIRKLEEIRLIRNEVMHFRPEGIGKSKTETLRNFVSYLRSLAAYRNSQ